MKTYGTAKIKLHAFSTLALDYIIIIFGMTTLHEPKPSLEVSSLVFLTTGFSRNGAVIPTPNLQPRG
jgi:hypothetical protein